MLRKACDIYWARQEFWRAEKNFEAGGNPTIGRPHSAERQGIASAHRQANAAGLER